MNGLPEGPAAAPTIPGRWRREARVLKLAAREAQIVGLVPRIEAGAAGVRSLLAEATAEKVAWVRAGGR
jgi:hypothetical protein